MATRVVADKRNRHYHRGTEYSFDELVTLRARTRIGGGGHAEVWQAKHGKCRTRSRIWPIGFARRAGYCGDLRQ